ncbi:hypothetical protein TSUD_145300 [Trifolium subterraneum]|uniref:Replication factor A C-terminal domain-containing protein n=1 Tax=Trifolium subterraneum TaxID=3900 RepID=A0A2Z6MLW6_TRISU|nr:hypothetical protein TSUD_145300 [Trifolium subterraneum]
MPPYKFTEFSAIKQGKVRPDVVVDIIGVFHELGYTQTVAGNKKIQINFTLKDLKYKLEFEVEYDKTIGKFVFWDRECNELLGKTAAELQLIMAEAGVTNPLEHPLCLDTICGRTFAFRAKWQPLWDTCSVQALKEDDAIVKQIIELFPKNEEPCKKLITTTTPSNDEGTSKLLITTTTPATFELNNTVSVENIMDDEIKNDSIVSATQDLSGTSEFDPESVSEFTPSRGKRVSASSSLSQNSEQDDCPTQLSSTKMNKIIKKEKTH